MTVVTPKDKSTEVEVAATACLKWGILGMFVWIIPVLGLAVPWMGLSAGRRGWQAGNRDRVRLGVVLCLISMGMGGLMLYWVSFLIFLMTVALNE